MKNIHSRVYIVLVCIKLKQAHPASGPPARKVSLAASTMQEQSMTYVQPQLLQIAYKQNPHHMHEILTHACFPPCICCKIRMRWLRITISPVYELHFYTHIYIYKYKYVYINIFKFIHDIVISCLRSLKATVNK